MSKSSKSKKAKAKPKTPSLWLHKGKQLWCKKSQGRFFYYESLANDPNGAKSLQQWIDESERIRLTGQRAKQQTPPDKLTVLELCDTYLQWKQRKLAPQSYREAKNACERIVRVFGGDRLVRGLTPDDFALMYDEAAETMGPVTLDHLVGRARAVFNWARKNNHINFTIPYGDGFKLSSTAERLHAANEAGDKILSREAILTLLDAADVQFRAMLWLCINCAYGPSDLGHLRLRDIDGSEWLAMPRPKTGAPRKAWLWPETRQALAAWLAVRPTDVPEELRELVFFRKSRQPWLDNGTFNHIAGRFAYVAKKCGVQHRGIYGLRHTHRTISDESLDQPACNFVMGHMPAQRDMSSIYRKPKTISDDRVRRVCETVRDWLLGKKKRKGS